MSDALIRTKPAYVQKSMGRLSMMKKGNKPLMEKRRRARINNSLMQLKELVLDATKKEAYTKLEKADILEMTVKFLEDQVACRYKAGEALSHYTHGYGECARDAVYVLSAVGAASAAGGSSHSVHTPPAMDDLCNCLAGHLQQKINMLRVKLTSSLQTAAAHYHGNRGITHGGGMPHGSGYVTSAAAIRTRGAIVGAAPLPTHHMCMVNGRPAMLARSTGQSQEVSPNNDVINNKPLIVPPRYCAEAAVAAAAHSRYRQLSCEGRPVTEFCGGGDGTPPSRDSTSVSSSSDDTSRETCSPNHQSDCRPWRPW